LRTLTIEKLELVVGGAENLGTDDGTFGSNVLGVESATAETLEADGANNQAGKLLDSADQDVVAGVDQP
jgi:hypothetical protein